MIDEHLATADHRAVEVGKKHCGHPSTPEPTGPDNQLSNFFLDLIQQKDFFERVSTPVDKSKAEILLMCLKFVLRSPTSLTNFSYLLKFVNALFCEPILKDSEYFIKKMFDVSHGTEFHAICPACNRYLGEYKSLESVVTCACDKVLDLSNLSNPNFFAVIDPSSFIADLLAIHEDYYFDTIEKKRISGHLKDIYDGIEYKEFFRSMLERQIRRFASALFNLDGAVPWEQSIFTAWPIYLAVNDIPISQRFKNLITCGIWFGKSKPEMSVFMDIFTKKMIQLSTTGISVNFPKRGRLNVKFFAICCCVDSIARPPIQGRKQWNGRFGCEHCLHPGVWTNTRRYPYDPQSQDLRTLKSTIKHIELAVKVPQSIKDGRSFGFKSASPLLNLPKFNFLSGFVPDPMHCCSLGVGEQITDLMLKTLEKSDIEYLSSALNGVRPPPQIGKPIKSLLHRHQWKAKEWENWILYYSIPILSLRLSKKLIDYWSLYVESLYIMSKNSIGLLEMDDVDVMIDEFVRKTEKIFGINAMTYNVHLQLHLPNSVRHWGPLWAHSTHCFESENNAVLKAIFAAKGVVLQIIRHIKILQSTYYLENRVMPDASLVVQKFCQDIDHRTAKNFLGMPSATYFGNGFPTPCTLQQAQELNLSNDIKEFHRMVKDGVLYCSCNRENEKSVNYFAYTDDGIFIRILKFVIDRSAEKEICICNIVKTFNNLLSENLRCLKKVINVENKIHAVKVEHISRICVFVEVEDNAYLIPVPNTHHYN